MEELHTKLRFTLKRLPQQHNGCMFYTVMIDLVLYHSSGTPGPFCSLLNNHTSLLSDSRLRAFLRALLVKTLLQLSWQTLLKGQSNRVKPSKA